MQIYYGKHEYDICNDTNTIVITPKAYNNIMASVTFKNNWFTGYGQTNDEAIVNMINTITEYRDELNSFLTATQSFVNDNIK